MTDDITHRHCSTTTQDQHSETSTPCPTSSSPRVFEESLVDEILLTDHATMLGHHNEKLFAYRESIRPDGRAASVDADQEGALEYSIVGSSPQNEEGTLNVCNLLIQKLNSEGGAWLAPEQGEGVVDCKAMNANDPLRTLQVQVVRANIDPNLWKQLNENCSFIAQKSGCGQLATRLAETIEHKSSRIPQRVRKGLVLALDATLLPGFAFDDVVEEFRGKYSSHVAQLEFDEVWLVGPVSELIKRLDKAI